jgi:hypothetical protein
MRHRRRIIATLLLVACSVPLCAQTRRALLVGINTYKPVEGEAPAEQPTLKVKGGRNVWSNRSNLDGGLNDVEAMRQALISRFGASRGTW